MSRFFIDRPIVAIVISIVTVIGGLVMLARLPIAQYPEIVPPIIQVTTTYTGADALTVEQSVATPIEQQVNGVQNMIYMKSINGSDGTMTLQVSFEVGTNIDLDQVFTQNRLAQATFAAAACGPSSTGRRCSRPSACRCWSSRSTRRTAATTPPSSATTPTSTSSTSSRAFRGVGQVKLFGTANYAMRVWVAPRHAREAPDHRHRRRSTPSRRRTS